MLKLLNLKNIQLNYKEKDLQTSKNTKLSQVPFSPQTEKYLLQAFQNESLFPHFAFLGNSGLGKKTILKNIIQKLYKKEPVIDSFSSLNSWLGVFEEGRFQGGKFQQAKNNFLIIPISELLKKTFLIHFLVSVLKEKKVERWHLPETLYFMEIPLKLFPLPVDFRVILTGEEEEFEKLLKKNFYIDDIFKMKIFLDYECDTSSKNLKKFSLVLDSLIQENSPSLDLSAKLRFLEEMLYQNENRNRFSTSLEDYQVIYQEAVSLFKKKKILSYNEIEKAIQNIKERNSTQKKKYYKSIQRKIYNFSLNGKRLGRIYGLSIFNPYGSLEEYGQVNIISARVGFGNGSFINVERESNMSGNSHDKGVFILQSYLKGLFPKVENLNLDISILFEQSNSTAIDGDSASVAELLACLSALSGVEIPTQIAITGAMSQYGEALAVGAVSQKIEAWFEFVSILGNKKDQYFVYIPEANQENLVFSKKSLDFMAKKNFFIKTYTHVMDIILDIFGISFGKLESDNTYTKGSLLRKIEQNLSKEKIKS